VREWLKRVLVRRKVRHPHPGVTAFRAAVAQAVAAEPHEDTIRELQSRAHALDVSDEEVELELEMLQGTLDLLAFRESVAQHGLPQVPHQHKALKGEPCHFAASAFLTADGAERTGRLMLTPTRLVFIATPLLVVPWRRGVRVREDARDLIVQAPARGASFRFRCNTFSDARRACWLAGRLRDAAASDPDRVRSGSSG
jgi:hypothetical protein